MKGDVSRMIKVFILILLISLLLVSLLTGLIGCSSSSEVTGVRLSVSHSVSIYCMHVSAVKSDNGKFMLYGYIYDKDGNMYESEDGFEMSADGADSLLKLMSQDMERTRKKPKFHADDAPSKKLELTYANEKKKSFVVTDVIENELREIFLHEFKDSCPTCVPSR